MNDALQLLGRLGQHRRISEARLRNQLGWTKRRLDAALEALRRRERVSVNRVGVVRKLDHLSEPAERMLAALPETGEFLSGAVIMQRLGLSPAALEAGRKELKAELLVHSRSGRGHGVLARRVATESRDRERLDLFAEQLRLEAGATPAPTAREEAFYACFLAPHEGHYPSYGALIVPPTRRTVDLEAHGFQSVGDARPVKDVRTFADGMNSFVLRRFRSDLGELLITSGFRGLESDAVDLARAIRGTVVQRNRAGVVRIATSKWTWIQEGGTWRRKSNAHDLVADVLQSVRAAGGQEPSPDVVRQLLSLCLHVLSPNHVGATLVWFFDREVIRQSGPNRVSHLGWQHAFAPPPLHVDEERHRPLLLHSLSQVDRAAIFNSSGQLQWLGVNLNPSTQLPVEGGTRHNSAACFSADHPEAVVFVVSADGPVTVFKDGAAVRTTRR